MGLTGDELTIIVVLLLTFNFIRHRSHHILTLLRSWFRDSVTATLSPIGWHNSYQSGVVSITIKLVFHFGRKPSWCTGGTTADPKHSSDNTPDTTLTILLRHPSTMIYCDQLYRNCQNRQHRTSNSHRAELVEDLWWLTVSKVTLKSIWTTLASSPVSKAICKVCDNYRRASQVPRPFV